MKTSRRIWLTVRASMFRSGVQRTQYMKKKKAYGAMGENVMIQSRKLPLYSENIFSETMCVLHPAFNF